MQFLHDLIIKAFFNILTEPLLVQKLTIHQQKAHDLSYLELEIRGSGPLAAKYIEKRVNLTEQSQGAIFFFFDLIFNILMLL